MFENLGFATKIEHGMLKISNGNLVIAKGMKRNGLHILEGSTVIAQAVVASQSHYDKTRLWHMRLGHISEKGLIGFSKQNLPCGDEIGKLEFCDQCILGKAQRVKF